MVCIYCHGELSVLNSRPQKVRNQTWRRRKCQNCGALFTSIEAIDLANAISVNHDGEFYAFSRDKLFISLYESCRHRPHAAQDANGLLDTIITQLLPKITKGSLAAAEITRTAHDVLQRFDTAAAVQYAAFHPLP